MRGKKYRALPGILAAAMLLSQTLAVSAEEVAENQIQTGEQTEMNVDESREETDVSGVEGNIQKEEVSEPEEVEESKDAPETQSVTETEEVLAEQQKASGKSDDRTKADGKWVLTSGKWWYRYADGSFPSDGRFNIDGKWYVFDKDGWMKTGWYQEGDDWYYFLNDGSAKMGWLKDKGIWYYLSSQEGVMYSDGKYEIEDSVYLFGKSGAMQTGWVKEDKTWYYYGPDGAMKKGWVKLKNIWYYLDLKDGSMYADTISNINGAEYIFNDLGAMHTGWVKRGDDWYYCNEKGAMQKEWALVDGKWYYLDPVDGKMFANGIKHIKEEDYCFGKSGAMAVGWFQYIKTWTDPDTGKTYKYTDWYYCEPENGAMHKEWLRLDGEWYYLHKEKGYRYAGDVYEIEGKNYGFDEEGVMASGWFERNVTFKNPDTGKTETYIEKYYFNHDGTPYSGWITKDGDWYWFDERGQMCADGIYKTDKGTKYSKFDKNGKWLGYVANPDKK